MTLRMVAELRLSPDSRDSDARADGLAVADIAFDEHPQQHAGRARSVVRRGVSSFMRPCSAPHDYGQSSCARAPESVKRLRMRALRIGLHRGQCYNGAAASKAAMALYQRPAMGFPVRSLRADRPILRSARRGVRRWRCCRTS